ncbi:aminopeptidase P family protein [Candidatus Microgenomates bacterium]|nr:aminopeptidase P family protein [Candidatus Microgenomates bacterium]
MKKIQQTLGAKKIGALLVSDFYNLAYLSQFFPLSPQEREAFLLITPHRGFLLTDGRYIEQARILKNDFNCLEITPRQNLVQIIANLVREEKVKCLGFEKTNLTFGEYEKLKAEVGIKLIPTYNIVEESRAIKDPKEITSIKRACQIADLAFAHLLKFLKPGLTEKEIADEIEWFIRKKGVVDLSFDPIVASGPNSAYPHHRSGDRKIKKQDIVLLDFGAKAENYCSDMTRVVFLGKATEEQKKVYNVVLEAQKKAIEFLKHYCHSKRSEESGNYGIKPSEVDKASRDYITSQGYPAIPHGLGHGVGLCEHESPRLSFKSKDTLKPGMVFSIEPGIYLQNQFGVRIEDLVVLTETGPQVSTKSSKEIIEL